MYTVCPKCALPLAVTAADLRAGQGYVRCGRCANVFNALLRLSEESGQPGSEGHGLIHDTEEEMDRASATMSRPALPDPVRAEPKAPEPAPQPAAPPPEQVKPRRIEDEFYDWESTNPSIGMAPLPVTPPAAGSAQRQPPALRLIDSPPRPEPLIEIEAFGEESDEESFEEPSDPKADEPIEDMDDLDDQDAAPSDEQEEEDSAPGEFRGTSTFETIVLEGDTYLQTAESIPEEVLASEIANVSRRIAEANNTAEFEALVERLSHPGSDSEPERGPVRDFEPAPELAALREATGEFKHAANLGLDSDLFGRERLWGDWRLIAGAAALALVLILQGLNHWRDEIATHSGWFGPMSALSAMLGEPLHPDWDLGAYDLRQLGAAPDSPDNQTLKVRLSLTNTGPHPQALPLIRLTLRDRYGKAVSRGELEPAQYLPKEARGLDMISRDQRIDTEVRVLDPTRQASSFELDVCVRAAGGGLRCAGDTPAVARAL